MRRICKKRKKIANWARNPVLSKTLQGASFLTFDPFLLSCLIFVNLSLSLSFFFNYFAEASSRVLKKGARPSRESLTRTIV